MPATRVRPKGQITIPRSIAVAADLQEGDPIEVELVPEGILLRPQRAIDATQSWFWTEQWREGEDEASQEIAAGNFDSFGSDEEFVASL